MNYRHAYHAGNFADVLKHALLVRLIRSMQRKEKGFLFVDTHAGRGLYDLEQAALGDTQERAPEWPDGIGRLWGRTDMPAEVADYAELVRAADQGRGNLTQEPRFYPGSPRIAKALARPQDRLELWEKHPEECGALREEFHGERRVSVHCADGYGALRACLPPAERRALVLIDPPFESASEWDHIASSMDEGMRRMPGATYAVWYPVSDRVPAGAYLDSLRLAGKPSFVADLNVPHSGPGISGCGVLVVNPPWKVDGEARVIVDYLAAALDRGQQAQGSVRWIVPK